MTKKTDKPKKMKKAEKSKKSEKRAAADASASTDQNISDARDSTATKFTVNDKVSIINTTLQGTVVDPTLRIAVKTVHGDVEHWSVDHITLTSEVSDGE